MVKSIITIAVAVAILIGGTIFEQSVVLNQFEEFSCVTCELKEKAEKGEATVDDMLNLQENWHNKKKFLHMFIPHNELKEVELWISEAISFAKYDNKEELVDKLRVLCDLSKEIPKTFLIRLDNIL